MLALSLFTLALAFVTSALPAKKHAKAQLITQCTVSNTVALTFDDGPYQYLRNVSQILQDAGAKGTFFFNGNNWDCIYNVDEYERVKYAYSMGHQIASHTWSHAHLNSLTRDQVNDELFRVDQALQRIIGVIPAFMRPPYGEYNDQVLEVAGERGETVVMWDFDSGDSLHATVAESNQKYDDVVKNHPDTLLALNHEVYNTTVFEVLPHAIKVLQDAGYKLVTVAECLGKEPYQTVGPPGVPDGSWTC